MALTNYLTKSNFYSYSGLSASDVNDNYVDFMISKFNDVIVKKLTKLFTLTLAQTWKYYNVNSDSVVPVGPWQKTNLVVKIGEDGNAILTTLVEGTDFRVLYHLSYPDSQEDNPVIAIKLYTNFLNTYRKYLQIEGTSGFSDGIPEELMLDADLYEILKKAVLSNSQEANSGGAGKVASSRMDVVSVSFDNSRQGLTTREAISECIAKIDDIEKMYAYNPQNQAKVIG